MHSDATSRTTSSIGEAIVDRYLSLDTRALALFRVYFGLLLFGDVVRRIPQAALYYSNDGVLSNHFALFAPLSSRPFSLLFALSSAREVTAAFVAMAACYLCLAVGYRTRLMQVLAVLFTVSVNQRNPMLENGGCVVLVLLAMWTAFLPLGSRMSIDALRGEAGGDAPAPRRVVTLVALGLLLQTAAIYFFNGVQKTGEDWKLGTVVHYLLWQDRIATPLAGWLRQHEPAWLSPIATHGTLWLEMASPLLLFAPIGWQRLRVIHVVAMSTFHLTIAALCNLGPFSWAMVALNLLLLPSTAMDALSARSERLTSTFHSALAVVAAALGPISVVRRKWTGPLREGVVALLLATMALQVANENSWLKDRLPARLTGGPGRLSAISDYGRIGQSWIMFRDAPRSDGRLVVDGVTEDGRHIDVFTGSAPDFDAAFHGPWGHSQLDCDYQLKISWADNDRYRGELAGYLKRWHEVARRPKEDQLASYRVFWVTHKSPPPGFTVPYEIERHLIVTSN